MASYMYKDEIKKSMRVIKYAVEFGGEKYSYCMYLAGTIPRLHRVTKITEKKFNKHADAGKRLADETEVLSRVASKLKKQRVYRKSPVRDTVAVDTPVALAREKDALITAVCNSSRGLDGIFEDGIEYVYIGEDNSNKCSILVEDGAGFVCSVNRNKFILRSNKT